MLRRRQRQLTDEERRLWRLAMRDTEPLHSEPPTAPRPPEAHKPVSRPSVPPTKQIATQAVPTKLAAPRQKPSELDRVRPVDIDRRSWQRLKRGNIALDGRIDLHGLTQAQAHERLNGFIMAMQARGCRTVLVITGMGRSGDGVLRQMVPRWLNEPSNRQRIVTFTQAQLRHGGSGALYVLLKKRR